MQLYELAWGIVTSICSLFLKAGHMRKRNCHPVTREMFTQGDKSIASCVVQVTGNCGLRSNMLEFMIKMERKELLLDSKNFCCK